MKVIIVLGVSFLLVSIEQWLEGTIAVSGLLAVVSMACVLTMKCEPSVSKRLSEKFGKLWLAAEVILFGGNDIGCAYIPFDRSSIMYC